ncbi:hypothetical protein ACFV2U_54580 [Streptomyces sp. NPDC059697]|uniref:cyanobactin maturation protease PatG family protein n=1 Tax=Streptomyces sp. NPDC059697 TaxID=3346912 RepID=UPI003692E202
MTTWIPRAVPARRTRPRWSKRDSETKCAEFTWKSRLTRTWSIWVRSSRPFSTGHDPFGHGIYAKAAEAHAAEAALSGVEVRPSRLGGPRNIMDVVFSFTHRRTDVTEKHFVRVDVSEEFPFLVTKLSPYYER